VLVRERQAGETLPAAPTHVIAAARRLTTDRRRWRSTGHLGRAAGWGLAAAASVVVCVAGYRVGLQAAPSPWPGDVMAEEVSFGLLDELPESGLDLLGLTQQEVSP